MENKRGLSPVIATVLLVLVTVAAISALSGFVVPFVKNSLDKAGECPLYQESYTFDNNFGFNCYNSTNSYALSVKYVKASEGVKGFNVAFKKGEVVKSVEFREDSNDIRIINSSNMKLPNQGESLTYILVLTEKYDSAEIYPVLESGRICNNPSSINLKRCANEKLY